MAFGDDLEVIATAGPNLRFVQIQVNCVGMTAVRVRRKPVSGTGLITVRGHSWGPPSGPDLHIAFDREAPQGLILTYVVSVDDGSTKVSKRVTTDVALDYEGDYIMPVGLAELGMNITVEKGGAGALRREVVKGSVNVLGRGDPLTVFWGRQWWSGSWTFLTLDAGEYERFLRIISYPAVFFAPRPDAGVDEPVFVLMDSVTEERTTPRYNEPSRRWSVDLQQIARPPATYQPPPVSVSWGTRLAEGRTWQQVKSNYLDWLDYSGFARPITEPFSASATALDPGEDIQPEDDPVVTFDSSLTDETPGVVTP